MGLVVDLIFPRPQGLNLKDASMSFSAATLPTLPALTTSTPIPTEARGKVRAFIKSRRQWLAFTIAKALDSRDVKNGHLIEFALQHGYGDAVMLIIAGEKHQAAVSAPAVLPAAPQAEVDQADKYEARLASEPQDGIEAACEEFDAVFGEGADKLADAGIAQFDADTVLASVDQFLSPFVKDELIKALAPVIVRANTPEVVEKIVVQQAAQVAPAGALPFAVQGARVKLGKLFGYKGGQADKEISFWEARGAAPAVDPHYVVEPFNMAMLATALDRGTNVWLTGPAGSGKTSLPQQFCAYTGRPFVKLSFTRNSHVDDMLGGQGMTAGSSGWEDGALVQAMRRPGTVILLDEITLAPAGVQGIFQGAADDHRTLTLPTGEKITAAPGVVFCVADNTAGNGDETGLYAGTNQANAALVNRFGRMIRIGYMSKGQEASALHNHTGAARKACEHVAEFVARARSMPGMENLVLSLRNMIALVRTVQDGFTPKDAAEVTILNRLPSTERATLETLFTLTWAGEFAALLKGEAAPKAPSDSASSKAFDDEVSASLRR